MDKEYSRNQGRREDNSRGERDNNRKRDSFQPGNSDRRERGSRDDRPRTYNNDSRGDGGNRERREYRTEGNRSEGNRFNTDRRERGNSDRQEGRDRNPNRDTRSNGGGYTGSNSEGGERRRIYRSGDSPERRERSSREGGERNREFNRSERPVRERNSGERERSERNYNQDNRRSDNSSRERKPYRERGEGERTYNNNRPERSEGGQGERRKFPVKRDNEYRSSGNYARKEISKEDKEGLRQRHYSQKKILAHRLKNETQETELRLNRYISMGGICSRRDADELIKTGRVKVNGEVVLTVGVKVQKKDKIEVDGAVIVPERKVYLALNKPKDYVTTVEDPLERRTVMSLVAGACKERIYPVGRLDRQTTGILLFTNDGELAKKLTHPKYDNKKIYHVFLDKPATEQDIEAIATGIELEDGFVQADEVSFASEDKTEVGIEIHSGKNRVVRRIFEHFGYQIVKLDRVYFAGITKKNIPRGKWRFLTQDEVTMLKYY